MQNTNVRAAAFWIGKKIYEWALPLALVAAMITVHQYVQVIVSRSPEYQLSEKKLRRLGIKSESMSLLNDDSLQRLGEAVRKDPSVKRIVDIRRSYPSGFEIRVEPRSPFVSVKTGEGFVALDSEAVRLEGDFPKTPSTQTGLTIVGLLTGAPSAGRVWVDDDVKVAFDMIRLVQSTSLLRNIVTTIDVANLRGRLIPADPEIVLLTKSGCRLHWGGSPSSTDGLELPVAEKIANLAVICQTYPSLGGLDYAKIYVRNRPTVRRVKPSGPANQS